MTQHLHQGFPGWVLRHAGWMIFCLALLIRLVIIVATKTYTSIEHTEVVNIATSLASKGTFADAFGDTGPTAHAAPLYPILLSLIFRVFGNGVAGEFAQEAFSSFIASLVYGLLPTLSVACEIGSQTGILAGFVGALAPVNFWSETKGSFEAALTAFGLVIVCIVILKSWQSATFSMRSAFRVGGISGITLLSSPVVAPVILAALVLTCGLFQKQKGRECFRFSATVLVISILCLAPWAIRNYLVLGGAVWLRSNLGLELYVANSDLAAPNMNDNFRSGWFAHAHPNASLAERTKLRAMGELPYQHEKMAAALRWIKGHPARFAGLTEQHIFYFWFPRMARLPQSIFMGLFTIGAIPGLYALFRTRNQVAWLFSAILALYPLIYYIVASFPRYRYPIDWLLLFLNAFWVSSLISHAKLDSERRLTRSLPDAPSSA